MRTSYATIMAAATLAATSNAFWGKGHLLVSRHAEAMLDVDAPDALKAALEVLSYLEESNKTLTKDEDKHPFTECATFADNIKGLGFSFQSGWHFIDQPLTPEGKTIEDYPDFKADTVDVLDALDSLTAFLKGETLSSPNTYIDQIQSSFDDENDQKSFALRLVIHYVGDIHQPLHAVAGVSDEFPKGDRGGNSEWIDPNVEGVGNLHQVWDSVIYSYIGYETLPLNDSDWEFYSTEAATLAKTYPIDEAKLEAGKFQTWADESFQMAKTLVYPGLVLHELPSDEYKQKAAPALKERIMYGGARLAALIEDIYGASVAQSFL